MGIIIFFWSTSVWRKGDRQARIIFSGGETPDAGKMIAYERGVQAKGNLHIGTERHDREFENRKKQGTGSRHSYLCIGTKTLSVVHLKAGKKGSRKRQSPLTAVNRFFEKGLVAPTKVALGAAYRANFWRFTL